MGQGGRAKEIAVGRPCRRLGSGASPSGPLLMHSTYSTLSTLSPRLQPPSSLSFSSQHPARCLYCRFSRSHAPSREAFLSFIPLSPRSLPADDDVCVPSTQQRPSLQHQPPHSGTDSIHPPRSYETRFLYVVTFHGTRLSPCILRLPPMSA